MYYDFVIQESDYFNIQYPSINNIKHTIINQYIISKIDHLAETKSITMFDDVKYDVFINKHDIEEKIYLALVRKYQFEIFKYKTIKRYILRLSASEFLPYKNKILRKIRKILSNRDEIIGIDTNRKKITEQRYWFYNCLIEKIKEDMT